VSRLSLVFRSQRSALSLGNVGFATTTDVQRQLHPPDKQDVAARLLLELRRLALTDTESTHSVVSRGPEVLAHTTLANGSMLLKMSNTSLYVSAGILTGCTVIALPHFLIVFSFRVSIGYEVCAESLKFKRCRQQLLDLRNQLTTIYFIWMRFMVTGMHTTAGRPPAKPILCRLLPCELQCSLRACWCPKRDF